MADLGNAHLKEVRDGLVGDIVEQGRKLGAPVPDIRKAEQFIDPIMRKVEVDLAREESVPPAAPAPPPTAAEKSAKAGEWFGEEGHSPLIGGPKSRVKDDPNAPVEARSKVLGEYAIGRDGKMKALNGAPMPKGPTLLELVIKKMLALPDWRAQIIAANNLCDKHLSAMPGCVLCERREARLLEIVGAANKKFTQRERRLIVGGK